MKEFIEFANQTGLSSLIICYFIFKDYKQTNTIISLMVELKGCLTSFEKILEKFNKKGEN